MIYGIGYDLCKIERMKKSLQSETFCKRVFGSAEWAALQALEENRRAESAAACFAAKEAFLKAAGTGLGGFPLAELKRCAKKAAHRIMLWRAALPSGCRRRGCGPI